MSAHAVFLDGYQIDRFEVTNRAYGRFVSETGHEPPGFAGEEAVNGVDQPVVGVTWFDAVAYCAWASKRLCSEAEWEKAARGPDGRLYPWGNEAPTDGRLNFNGQQGRPAPVGSYPEGNSPYGTADMAGNVWEWVADWYRPDYYQNSPDRNPKGPDTGAFRVYRGGSWRNGAPAVRGNERGRLAPIRNGIDIGFRCCRG